MLSYVFLLKVFMIRHLVCCKSLKSNGDIDTAVLFLAGMFISIIHENKKMTRVSYKPLCLFKTSSCNRRKRGRQKVVFKTKEAELVRLTYSTNNLLTLPDARGFEHHTTEACCRRGFWGVSVERANDLLWSCHAWTNRTTAAYCITVCRGVTYTSSRVIVNRPHRRKAAVCCI